MTAPNSPNERAKTVEKIADDFCEGRFDHRGGYRFTVTELARAFESYADSVAEERVKDIELEYLKMTQAKNDYKELYENAFRAGQERMRERVAKHMIDSNCSGTLAAQHIRSLEVEEK